MACGRFRTDLSAFVDGTLTPKREEQVLYHIAGCAECREEVHEIAALCAKLSGCRASDAPGTLTAKLESIAGDNAATPLYMAQGCGKLPTSSHRRRWLIAQGGCALLVVMVSVVVLAVLVAPEPVRVADPVGSAREQYAKSSAALNVNEALGAMLLAGERGADFGEPVDYTSLRGGEQTRDISTAEAAQVLGRAVDFDRSLIGQQRVYVADGDGQYFTAQVAVTKVQGEGAQLAVTDAQGHQFVSAFLPGAVGAPQEARRWSFVRYTDTWQVAGREATRVTAVGGGGPVASWWVDVDTGLLLWAERYDASGKVGVAVGYTEVEYESASLPRASYAFALQPVTSSGTAGWCNGLECPGELAGLELVAFTTADQNGTRTMSLVYSDGVDTAVVEWTEGVLAEDATTRADAVAGLPSVAAWQCGDLVVTLATNASSSVMSEMIDDLPDAEAYHRSPADRVAAGISRLVGIG